MSKATASPRPSYPRAATTPSSRSIRRIGYRLRRAFAAFAADLQQTGRKTRGNPRLSAKRRRAKQRTARGADCVLLHAHGSQVSEIYHLSPENQRQITAAEQRKTAAITAT